MKDAGRAVMGMRLFVAEPGDNVPEGTVLIMNPEQAEHALLCTELARLRGLLASETAAREGAEAQRDHFREGMKIQHDMLLVVERVLSQGVCGCERCSANLRELARPIARVTVMFAADSALARGEGET